MQGAPAIFVPQLLFAGIFLRIEQIPVWIRWAQYLCALKFGINLFIANEFGDAACDAAHLAACRKLLDASDARADLWWAYGLVLLGIFLAFRTLGLVVLARKARGFALA
jgi:hypothetical protein